MGIVPVFRVTGILGQQFTGDLGALAAVQKSLFLAAHGHRAFPVKGMAVGRDTAPAMAAFCESTAVAAQTASCVDHFYHLPKKPELVYAFFGAGRKAGRMQKEPSPKKGWLFFILHATRHISRVLLKTAIFLDLPSPEGSSHLDGTRRAGGNGPLSVLLRIGFT